MEWLRQVEEAAGVEIEWQEISADWDQIKAAMFASGDIPDLLFNATVMSDYTTYVGLFENLIPWINETDTPNIYKFFQAHPEAKNLALMADGSMYGTPKYQRFWPSVATSMYTNGNGDTTDEFPFDFLQWVGQYSPVMLLGSTGIQMVNFFQDGYFAEGGVVKNVFADERYKELVVYLKDL
jgi:putative aldouronate transport system substrate-binding protein